MKNQNKWELKFCEKSLRLINSWKAVLGLIQRYLSQPYDVNIKIHGSWIERIMSNNCYYRIK